jgi:ribosomal-protein-alanine N-acetyltransferase
MLAELEPTFSLRPATEQDIPKVMEIERVSYPFPWTEEAFIHEFQKPFSHFLVLSDDQTDELIAGYLVFWMLFEECHILNIAVHSNYRGLGFAKQMLSKARDMALQKNLKRMFLEVRKSNVAAVALYQKLGFFIDHIKKNFYEDGEDAYFMQLFLDKSNTI